jgi:uridine kinase
MLVGICGRSCCGKDTISKSIASVNRNVLHINCDLFFKSKTTCSYKGYTNWEDVNSLRIDHLTNVIQAFKEHRGIVLQDRSPWWGAYDCEIFKEDLIDRDIIIFQGFLLFAVKEIVDKFDHKIFINIDDETLLYRRLLRDKSLDHIDYYHDVVIPVSHLYEKDERDQKKCANIIFDSNNESINSITNKVLSYINSRISGSHKLINPSNSKTWTVQPGALLCDQEWHPIDFMDLKAHVQNCEQWMNEGEDNIVEGATFQYRKNVNTGDFEVRLGKELDPIYNYKGIYRHIFRYTTEHTEPKKAIK